MNEDAFRKTVIETLRYDNKWKNRMQHFRYVYQETPDFDLQDTLIQGIRDAKYLIWISVA